MTVWVVNAAVALLMVILVLYFYANYSSKVCYHSFETTFAKGALDQGSRYPQPFMRVQQELDLQLQTPSS